MAVAVFEAHCKPVSGSYYFFGRISVTAFMDENCVQAQNGHSCIVKTLRSLFKTFAFCQCSFPHRQFSSHKTYLSHAKRQFFFSDCNICLACSVTDGYIKRGVHAYEPKFVIC